MMRPTIVAGIVLAVGLLISVALWRNAETSWQQETRAHFDASTGQGLAAIQRRMEEYRALVLGMQGLFSASGNVNRIEFQRYSNTLTRRLRVPGIRAMHFTRLVPDAGKAAFVAAVRADRTTRKEGFPDFRIHPESTQAEYFVIEFIEPFEENRRAFGLDASSQAINRESFLGARDSGTISITEPFQLIQAQAGDRGLVMRAPVYSYGAPVTSVAERRLAFHGLVGVSLNASQIFSDILAEPYLDGLSVDIHDIKAGDGGGSRAPARQLIARQFGAPPASDTVHPLLSSEAIIPVGERLWEVRFTTSERWYAARRGNDVPMFILATGILISFLLAALYLSLARSRTRAEAVAMRMTKELRQNEKRFRAMATMSSDWFWEQDAEGRFVSISGPVVDGRSKVPLPLEQIKGKTRWELWPSALRPAQWIEHRRLLDERKPFEMEYAISDERGQERWLNIRGEARFDDSGLFLGYHGTARDITIARQAELEMAAKTKVLQATLENMSQGISVVDANLRLAAFNRQFCDILEFPGEMAYIGAPFESFIRHNAQRGDYGPCDVEAKVAEMLERAKDTQPHSFKRTRPNGRVVEVVGNPLPGGGFVTTYADVTEQERAQHAVRVNEARLRRAELASKFGNWEFDPESQRVIASAGAARIFGVAPGEFDYATISDLPLPEYRPLLDRALRNLVNKGEPYDIEYRITTRDTKEEKDIHSIAVLDKDKRVLFGVVQDITRRKQAEARLQLAASVFTHAREGITITDAQGAIVEVNQAFTDITGFSYDEVIGRNPRILRSGRQTAAFYEEMWRALLDEGHWSGEIWNRHKDGHVYAEMLTISAVRDATGTTRNYVALFNDITALKEHQGQLEHIAHYDALTGLPNRVLLADRLQQAMVHAQRRGQSLAVAYLDLDGFKSINDRFGHDAGDQLLMIVANRMKQSLREGDTLARLGGDEFVAVLLDLADVAASVPMLGRLLTAAAQPVQVGDLSLQVSASLGVTFYLNADDVDADQLLRQADQAMYQAKLAGKNRYHVFDAEQDRSVRGHHESLERIRLALEADEFLLYFQPKVNMRTGSIVGAEALIRWQHPERGLLPPAVFLPVIEDNPLAVKVGDWVIDKALAQMAIWRAAGQNIPVSVNVAARQLQQADFVERLRAALARHPDLPSGDLQMEVLETSALEDLARISQVIGTCREIGVNFALDDFGTGYSSLTYLKHLPVSTLKIDQSFVRNMLEDPDDLAILEGVLGLATAFRREVIAEGVETLEHGAMLLQLGCELAQGYGIARPMPASAFAEWSALWRPDPSWRDLPPLSGEDLPLLFAGAEHRAWIAAMECHIRDGQEAPPPLDHHQCRFGIWLQGKGRQRYGTSSSFPALEQLHEQVHAVAADLCDRLASGQRQAALEGLTPLRELRDALLERLHALRSTAS